MCISQRPFSEQKSKKYTLSSWHYVDATLPCKQTNTHNKEHNKRSAPPQGSKLPKAPIFASLSSLLLRGLQAPGDAISHEALPTTHQHISIHKPHTCSHNIRCMRAQYHRTKSHIHKDANAQLTSHKMHTQGAIKYKHY